MKTSLKRFVLDEKQHEKNILEFAKIKNSLQPRQKGDNRAWFLKIANQNTIRFTDKSKNQIVIHKPTLVSPVKPEEKRNTLADKNTIVYKPSADLLKLK
jgi:hypothetical protein